VLGRATTYDELRALAAAGGVGEDLVVQTPYGDSGQTTCFVSSQADWDAHAGDMAREELKVMRRINCREAAIEGVITRHGTLVGPLMAELAGFPELTPYGGGWCGNDVSSTVLTDRHREIARKRTRAMGDRLAAEGYRGYFELDFLVDQDTKEVYLGELNPRITGASSMTNHAAFAHADAPLFLFHLLEFSGVPFDIDVAELNARWADPLNIDSWCQLVIKHTDDSIDLLSQAPETGIWRMNDDGSIVYDRFDYHRRAVESEKEAFFLRILKSGDYRYEGADLGILVTRGRAMDTKFQLTDRSKAWINGIRRHFQARPLTADCPRSTLSPSTRYARDSSIGLNAPNVRSICSDVRFGRRNTIGMSAPAACHCARRSRASAGAPNAVSSSSRLSASRGTSPVNLGLLAPITASISRLNP
jgi:hypothetical protein